MTDNYEHDPTAEALRHSLARHAAEAPSGDMLAERIIHAADRESASHPGAPRRSWRSWALPLVAAAAVAGVVLAVVGIVNYHPTSPPAGSQSVSLAPTESPSPTTSPTSPTASRTASNAPDLTGVKIVDLTFVSENSGWALASADCLTTSGRCTALLRTTDGEHWVSLPGARFNVPGVSAGCGIQSPTCVTNLRFANDQVGYAFGPSAFYMTTDGGTTWDQQPGGAVQLETLDQNVIRVTSSGSGCPAWCNVQVETSAVGSTTWTRTKLGQTPGYGVQLTRGGHDAYLLFFGHPAGGGSTATSLLYRSTDDGRTWQAEGEPCPQTSQEIDSAAIAAAGADRVTVECMPRQQPQHYYAATSDDAGAHFTAQPGQIPEAGIGGPIAGDPATVLVAAGNGLARSTDGGQTWQPVPDVTGEVTFVGFESNQVGRAVTNNRIIWTTRDGGKTWTAAYFG
jgi:photosystem II stability/assembly factor-like uncharacterized protein